MDEALAIASDTSWVNVTVRGIASRLNYKAPVLYQYFRSKNDLLLSIIERGFLRLSEEMHQAMLEGKTTEEKLLAMARARFNFALENEALHSLMFSTDSPLWHKKVLFTAMAKTKNEIKALIQGISGREDECMDLITNFISLIRGYNYFASEIPQKKADAEFFGGVPPVDALESAINRFIKSIRPDE